MSSVPFWNSPFWDFVSDFERGKQQPFPFNQQYRGFGTDPDHDENKKDDLAQDDMMGGGDFGEGPSNPPHFHRDAPPPPFEGHYPHTHDPSTHPGPPTPSGDVPGHEAHGPLPHRHRGPGGPGGPDGRHFHPHPPHAGGPSSHGHGHGHQGWRGGRGRFCGRRGGGRGGRHNWWERGADAPFDVSRLAEFFGAQLFGHPAAAESAQARDDGEDFQPDVDVFDSEAAYHIHVSLPGARKEDVGVNWIQETSELQVAGVVYRPGGEELLKSLALSERAVGVFDRKVRLGSRTSPGRVDADMITAKMEDGILRVTVPKETGDFVEVRKVDVQ